MRLNESPSWFVPSGQLANSRRSFSGRVVINPRRLADTSQALNDVAGDLGVSIPAPPRLPPSGAQLTSELDRIEEQLRRVAHELRASASTLIRRAQFANAGQVMNGTAPTDELAAADFHASEIRADMDERGLDPTERRIIEDLIEKGLTHHQYLELLHGGHVLIEGRGLYKDWQDLGGVYDRSGSNSHYRKPNDWGRDGPKWGPHYGIDTDHLGGVLFGPGPLGSTFIQLEGHGARLDFLDVDPKFDVRPSSPMGGRPPLTVDVGLDVDGKGKNAVELGKHMEDFGKYQWDVEAKNRGPHGTSVHNDAHPIVLGNVNVPKPTRKQLNEEFDQMLQRARRNFLVRHPRMYNLGGALAGLSMNEQDLLAEGLLPMSRDDYTHPERR